MANVNPTESRIYKTRGNAIEASSKMGDPDRVWACVKKLGTGAGWVIQFEDIDGAPQGTLCNDGLVRAS